ncbi:MAG: hypothetical protein JXQ71_10525, partial [Verrucomicrobia bacterium]|nr:hypothetical protein [Verrucomicrobiota bacterium]
GFVNRRSSVQSRPLAPAIADWQLPIANCQLKLEIRTRHLEIGQQLPIAENWKLALDNWKLPGSFPAARRDAA